MTDFDSLYRVVSISGKAARQWIEERHYARARPQVVYAFALVDNKSHGIKGILTFGRMLNAPSCSFCGPEYRNRVYEFNRLFIDLKDSERRNVATWFCSQAIKQLPGGLILVSYADTNQGHVGYVYQALNWIYTGLGGNDRVYVHVKSGELQNTRAYSQTRERAELAKRLLKEGKLIVKKIKPKHRYVYFTGNKAEKRKLRKALRFEVLPYPKGESKHYDDSGDRKPVSIGLGLQDYKKRGSA